MENQEQQIEKDLLKQCYQKIGAYELMVDNQKRFIDVQDNLIKDIKEANQGMNDELIRRGRTIEILGEELDEYEGMFGSYHIRFSN
jgi:hypothetical protein